MKIAFIHNERKLQTGAHYINDLMSRELCARNVTVQHFYPRTALIDNNVHLKGIQNILFFHSLLEHKNAILRCNLIQGTTYTPIAFLPFSIPVVSHFGSTTEGFLAATPYFHSIKDKTLKAFWMELYKNHIIKELNIKTRRPLYDIADIEIYVAKRVQAVLATSQIVADDLIRQGVPSQQIHLVHNAIEDFWFEGRRDEVRPMPSLIFIGRLGGDVFTLKLKGLDRLAAVYRKFPAMKKITIGMTSNKLLARFIRNAFENNETMINAYKEQIKQKLIHEKGSIFLGTSRYEGFSLSLVEAMSQGIVPISFPVGVAPEIIKNEVNGYIVHSVDEMAERIEELEKNTVLRLSLADKAQETAEQFRPSHMAERLLSVYKEVIFSA